MTATQEQAGSAVLPVNTPDLYSLHGDQLRITYSTTSFDGKPRFDYQDATQIHSFEGDQIRTVTTEIGMLVTVTLCRSIDRGSTTFTLLVPTVNLGSSQQAPIDTMGITTIRRFSPVPAFNQGQTELYRVTPLIGTASFVNF
ncbi:MAG TPA: hypothetical protein VF003_18820 [Pseudonocardiaceae bacterium]